jgi:hypothetical protein
MTRLFSLLFFTISISTISQNKIEGFGNYKINKMTVLSFQDFAEANSFKMGSINSFSEYSQFKKDNYLPYLRNKKVFVAEVFHNSLKNYNSPPNSNICKNSRVFYIPATEIATIKFEETFLTFFNDTLVRIDTDYNSEIEKPLKLKYGEPKTTNYSDTINCIEEISEKKYTETEKSIFKVWENGNINCTLLLASKFNNECEKELLSAIFIELDGKKKEIQDCHTKEINKRKKIELKEF